MNRQLVSSSNIASIGYDPDVQTLEIQFHKGGIYQYYNVPVSIYNALMSASSHGTYFDQHIKKSSYRFNKVG